MDNTAKNFALQLGSLISLYVSIGALISLLLSTVTILYPDVANPYENTSATSSIRYAIAMLVVFFPTYLTLTRLVNSIRRREQGTYLTLTKWLIYISLLVGGGVILGDFVAILWSFLNGELTIRFILKALAVFLIVGAAFTYYVFDARNYWQTHEQESIRYGLAVAFIVMLALVFGFNKIESPNEVRDINIDRTQINDLTQIQSRIESYVALNGRLPANLDEAYGELTRPSTSSERTPYSYSKTSDTQFKLCAEFASPSLPNEYPLYSEPMYIDKAGIQNAFDWSHTAGDWCFERFIVLLVPSTR